MPNDLEDTSGSVEPMNTERSPETKQLILNNALTGITIYQNMKMNGALQELKIQTQAQTQHLAGISKSQSEMLQKQDQTNALLEEKAIKERLDRAAKDVVFNFKIEKDKIANQPTNLERYLNAASCLQNFKQNRINYEDLPDISDKEFLYQAIKDLEKICSDSIEALSDEEVDDLSKLDRLKKDITLISRTKSKIMEERVKRDKTIKDLKKLSVSELAELENIFPETLEENKNISSEKKRFVTFRKSILATVIGFVAFIVAGGMSGGAGFINSTGSIKVLGFGGALLTVVGTVMFIWRCIVWYILGVKKAFAENNASKRREAVEQKALEERRKKLIEDAKKSFEEYLQKAAKKTKREFNIKNWSSFFADEVEKLEKEYKTALAKYPSINNKIKK